MSNLRHFREKAGLTLAELAKRAGTSQPQIFRLERGQRKLTKEWAIRLAPHLEVTPQQLLFPNSSSGSLDDQIKELLDHLSEAKKLKLLDLLVSFYDEQKR
ncbi:helix-turn-helix domain-containing protein [Bartonella sp. DGB2]|uniref:helix-turn-helix domain-containing protein n=1 Tax=Bartonella sp. DGB2 TaxID=3388426 RepID=UPI00398FFF1C